MQSTQTDERAERLQAELDACRDFIRSLGVTGFGSLLDGIETLTGKPPELSELEVSEEQIHDAMQRIRASAARLSVDESYRTLLPFKTEVLQIALAICTCTLRVDPHELVVQVERQLAKYIMVIKKEKEGEQ